MNTKDIKFFQRFDEFCAAMAGEGAFLVVTDRNGKTNVMTMGWASMGIIWYEPVMQVLVRPTRYTYALIENAAHFTVCVPVEKMKKELAFCGSRSGKDTDKVKECKFDMIPGKTKGTYVVGGCDLYYECELIHKNKVQKEALAPEIVKKYYPKPDQHTVYFGRIVKSYEKA